MISIDTTFASLIGSAIAPKKPEATYPNRVGNVIHPFKYGSRSVRSYLDMTGLSEGAIAARAGVPDITERRSNGEEYHIVIIRRSAVILAFSIWVSAAFAQNGKLNDPEIAHIAYTAGVIDVTAAKQALNRSTNKEVRAFAENMLRDHETVNQLALDLVKKLKVTPEDNDTSRSLSKSAASKLIELGKLKGAEFDKAYVSNEVAYHKTVDDALESMLIPGAGNAELKSLLQTGLKIFQGHEQHAEHLAASLK